MAPLAPSSGRPHGLRRWAPKKKSRVDEVGGEWKKDDNTPFDICGCPPPPQHSKSCNMYCDTNIIVVVVCVFVVL